VAEGHDVGLPAQRHLRLRLFPAVLHDGPDVDGRALAQSKRGLLPDYRRAAAAAAPDRDHDLRPDQQQRHDGDGRQFRLSPRPPENGGPDAGDRAARKVWRGDFDNARRGFFTSRKGQYESVEIMGLYWHFVDLVWVFIFALFYLW
jgi:hypothetical protein